MTRRYKAFISYSWADKDWGGWLHRTLELYRTPRALVGRETAIGPVPPGLHPIFKDREEEAAGHGVGAAIEAALAASDFLIVICSPRSATSQWVNREVAWFKTHKDKTRILALIVDGEPGAATRGNDAAECFPRTLTHKIGADLQPTEEAEDPPLAADARKEGDGKRGAKLKLAAALLGVGLDDLVKRDERRRTVRRRLAMSGMAAGMAIFAGIALYAGSQRDAAILARNDAVKARDDAEGIIELILTDLKQDLEGYGTLKSVTQIGNRAIGYYEGQDVKALTPDQLGRRARVLLMLGEADNKRGDLEAALARYKTAEATTSEQLARDPDNPQRIYDHAQSVFWVGYIAWQRGDHARAKEQFTEYHRLATRLVGIDPRNDDWQAELEYSYSNLGTLAMDEGEAAEAEGWFRKSLEVSLRLLEKHPDDIDRVLAVGQSYAWLADALHRMANLDGAGQTRLAEVALYEEHLSTAPALTSALVTAKTALALIHIAANDLSEAVAYARDSVSLSQAMLAKDSESTVAADRLSFASSILSEALRISGDYDGALEAARYSISVAERMLEQDGNVARWRGKLAAQARLALGNLYAENGENDAAREAYELAIADLRPLIENREADQIMLRRYCAALAGLARSSSEQGTRWAEIIELLTLNQVTHGPETLMILAEAYARLGNSIEARRISSQLSAEGFHHPDFARLLKDYPDLQDAADRSVR